jgi:hypothetical protein
VSVNVFCKIVLFIPKTEICEIILLFLKTKNHGFERAAKNFSRTFQELLLITDSYRDWRSGRICPNEAGRDGRRNRCAEDLTGIRTGKICYGRHGGSWYCNVGKGTKADLMEGLKNTRWSRNYFVPGGRSDRGRGIIEEL